MRRTTPLFLIAALFPAALAAADVSERLEIHPLFGSQGFAPAASGNTPGAPSAPLFAGAAGRFRAGLAAASAQGRGDSQVSTAQLGALGALRSGAAPDMTVRWRRGNGTPAEIRIGATSQPSLSIGVPPGMAELRANSRVFLNEVSGLLGIAAPDAELSLSSEGVDKLGRSHLRYKQVYEGLEVWPADVLVHFDPAGNVDLVNGAFIKTPSHVDADPSIAEADAQTTAVGEVPDGDLGNVVASDLIVFAGLGAPTAGPASGAFSSGKLDAQAPTLAWRIEVEVSLLSRWLVIVDAHTGAVLKAFNQVADANVQGNANDILGRNQTLNVWSEDGNFFLVDTSKPMFDPASDPPQPGSTTGGIFILDARNQPASSSPTELPDLFLEVAGSADGPWDDHAVSAAAGLSLTYDYYRDTFDRNSIDGEGGSLIGIVRFGQGLQNAFWTNGLMLFGDGLPFPGSIDVIGHEMTHGVTEKTSNLVYADQPGALNEGFSDIFGENVEALDFGGSPDWLKGDLLVSGGIQNYADCGSREYGPGIPFPSTLGEFVNTNEDNGGVHGNSCILNHAYYLLTEGLSNAVGRAKSEQIFYRALTVHLSRNSQFVDARLACVRAAEEIYGEGSPEATATGDAFDQVEVFDGAETPAPPDFPETTGDDALLLVQLDGTFFVYALGRLDPTLGDPAAGTLLAKNAVVPSRPSVTGDGSVVFFIDATNDACFINTAAGASDVESCLGFQDTFHSVAMSPDGNRYALVTLDAFGFPTNTITIVDLVAETETTFPLAAPLVDGAQIGTVLFAETMDFTADGRFLIYDALNEIPVADGSDLRLWSVYALDLELGRTLTLIEPSPGLDIGNPALAQTNDAFVTLDVADGSVINVVAVDLNTGIGQTIAPVGGIIGLPGYNGDDSAIVYATTDNSVTSGASIVSRAIGSDKITPVSDAVLEFSDAAIGVVYRRGTFTGPPDENNGIVGDVDGSGTVTAADALAALVIAVGGGGTCELCVCDLDGSGAVTSTDALAILRLAVGLSVTINAPACS